jgi:ATP-dependent RNA helicase DDX60
MQWMCNTSLEDYCNGLETDDYIGVSTNIIKGLGYIHDDVTLAMDHNVLCMVWELHDYLPEAVHLGAVLEQMYIRFCYNKTKGYKESDSTQNEFLSVLLHVVDRVPANDGEESLQQLLRVFPSDDGRALNEEAQSLWFETEKILTNQKQKIDSLDAAQSEKNKLHLAIPPAENESGDGVPLDKGVYEMLVMKQKGFSEDQSTARRNELKNRIVRLGQICQIAHNTIQQPHGKYETLEVHFRRMFSNIKYSVADMMTQLSNQEDVTEI